MILTGGTETAQRILAARPNLHLLAETGGKNCTILSSLSDRELAIKNVLHSAFSHAGQKCSATSLLLLEEEVYHDKGFRESLIDAVSSLKVGSAWDLRSKMGPLIRQPDGALLRGLKELEPGEAWAVMPSVVDDNPCLYSPGIKWDVTPGSFTHMTELFGPVLGVMPFRTLQQAIDLVHQTGYGLTSGLESLDDREQAYWSSRLVAGNLYINRSTTGAIVLRQPFGGMGKSAFGPGIKAGGPNYVVPLMNFATLEDQEEQANTPQKLEARSPQLPALGAFWTSLNDDRNQNSKQLRSQLTPEQWSNLKSALLDYDQFAVSEIRQKHDTLRLIGQDNFRLYQPMTHVRIRVCKSDSLLSIVARAAAVIAVGGRAALSHADGVHEDSMKLIEALTREWAADLEFIEESDEELVEAIQAGQVDRVRFASAANVPVAVRKAAEERFIYIADSPTSPCGRVELLWYVREQSLCVDYHRYGNLGFRATEDRAEPS